MTLAMYLTRLFAVRFLGALGAFAAMVEILDLVNTSEEILSRGQGIAGLGRYAALRLPVIAVDVAPFAALVGALFTFMALASKSEIVALRALGMPARKVVLLLGPVALAAGALHVAASDAVAPPAESALRDWMLRTEPQSEPAEDAEHWLRSGRRLIGFGEAALDGSRLSPVWIYERGAEGGLSARISAELAAYRGGEWVLEDVRLEAGGGEPAQERASMAYDLALGPSDVLELSQPVEHLSLGKLLSGATGGPTGARSQAFFATRLMTVASFLIVPLLMVAIAAPVAFASSRARTIGLQAAIGLAVGLSFILVAGILRTLGEAGVLAPAAAAWTAPLAFAALAWWRLRQVER